MTYASDLSRQEPQTPSGYHPLDWLQYLLQWFPYCWRWFKYELSLFALPENERVTSKSSSKANRFLWWVRVKKPYGEFTEEEEIDDVYAQTTDTRKKKNKNKLVNAIVKSNVGIALFGLGFGYSTIQLFTMWEWSLSLSVFASIGYWTIALLTIPLTLYVMFSIWQTRSLIQKNIVYQQKKSLARRLFMTLESTLLDPKKFTPLEKLKPLERIIDRLKAVFNFNSLSEISKKIARVLLNVTVVSVIAVVGGLSGPVLIGICAAAAFFAFVFEIRTQVQENKTNKLKRINAKTIELLEMDNKDRAAKLTIEFIHNKIKEEDKDLTFWDKWRSNQSRFFSDCAFALTTMTSAYVAITIYSVLSHEAWEKTSFYLGELSFASTAFDVVIGVGVVIVFFNIVSNVWTYHDYAEKQATLAKDIDQLCEEIRQIKKSNKDLTASKKIPTADWTTKVLDEADKDLFVKEAQKKSIRVFTTIGFLCLVPLLALAPWALALAVVAIVIVAVGVGVADYKIRSGKKLIENDIARLEEDKMNLLYHKNQLLIHGCELADKNQLLIHECELADRKKQSSTMQIVSTNPEKNNGSPSQQVLIATPQSTNSSNNSPVTVVVVAADGTKPTGYNPRTLTMLTSERTNSTSGTLSNDEDTVTHSNNASPSFDAAANKNFSNTSTNVVAAFTQ